MDEGFKEILHSFDLMVDHFDQKFDLVIEGQQVLAERMDRIVEKSDEEIGQLDKRLLRVEADLSTHKKDPNAHSGTAV